MRTKVMKTNFTKKRQFVISPELIADTKLGIIKSLDKICEENNIQYFAHGNLLIGCVHYNAVIPGKENSPWDIGLMRDDYNRLIKVLRNAAAEHNLFLDEYFGNTEYPQKLIRIGRECQVDFGDVLLREPCFIVLSPFDVAPDDFDFFCGFIRQIRRQNRKYSRILDKYSKAKGKKAQIKQRILCLGNTPAKVYRKREKIAAQFLNSDNQKVGRVILKKGEMLTKDKLFPLQKIPFYDMMLPCPNDYFKWTVSMTPEIVNRTKEIQEVDIFLLQEFDRVCKELNIGYFVCGGTMLGAMRHDGFIPWDDDVDVGMLRRDYDRFLREAGKYIDPRCFIQTRKSDSEVPYLFSKIRVDGTEYITEYSENRRYHKGICLDLFPFDVIPDDPQKQKRFLFKTQILVRIHNRFCNKGLPEPKFKSKIRSPRQLWYRFVGKAQRIVYKSMPLSITQHWYIKHVTKYNKLLDKKENCTVASFVPTYTYIKINDLLPYRRKSFENIEVSIPNKAEVFLTMQYGDFMEMPPKHQQVGHELIQYKADF